MKYRLANRKLQKKLDEISNGDFTRQLDYVVSMSRNHDPFITTRPVYFELDLDLDTRVVISIDVTPDMVVENASYNPKTWNKFPEVAPPEGVWMRVEWRDGEELRRDVARYVACCDVDEFVWFNKDVICDVERFRPWLNDDEIEAERKAEDKKDMHPDAIAARRYMGEED